MWTRPSSTMWAVTGVAIINLLVARDAVAATPRKPKPPRCAGGYFVVDGDPLIPGAVGPDALVVGLGGASTLSGCPGRKALTFRAKGKSGDDLIVKWPDCGAGRKALLQARISADCATVAGTFKAKGAKRRKFSGSDGIPTALRKPWDQPELPPGAKLVTPGDFLTASRAPGFRVLTPQTDAEDEAAAAAEDEANRATLAAFAAANPTRADFVSTGVDPSDPDLSQSADGNYLLTIVDDDGNPTEVVTQGPRTERAVRAETIRRFPTKENQLAIYASRYRYFQSIGLPASSPEELAQRPVEEIATTNTSIAAFVGLYETFSPLPGETVSESYPARCTLEIGAGDGTDGAGYCRHASDGLWNTATWPLKYYDTCVKKQAKRGTCVAFAITAGREMRLALKYDRWVNLSEQYLYGMAKLILQPANYGDGLQPTLLRQLFDTGYRQPFEETWDYNPSRSRTKDNEEQKYTQSCTGYTSDQAAYCSDTAHQSQILCMQAGASRTCAGQLAPPNGITVRSIEQPAELWNAADPIQSLANLIWTLRIEQVPVLLSIAVVKPFRTPDANGYVRRVVDAPLCKTVGPDDPAYDPALDNCIRTADCLCATGGHAILAVGYIPESLLPETAPKGSGGYLIIKNSWGCSGDGGYYYLPAGFVRSIVRSARPIGDVETSAPLPDQPTEPGMIFQYQPAPPSIRIVQPLASDSFVEGQGVPLSIVGADYQYERWALLGTTRWTSSRDGLISEGENTTGMLTAGTHTITASYTGKLRTTVTDSTTLVVGPRPPNIPPTARFSSFVELAGRDCPVACGGSSCVVGFGDGIDPEDGVLRSDASVRWYTQIGTGPRALKSTGASTGNQGKFLFCGRLCDYTWHFILQVEDSLGQKAEARRDLETPGCVN